MEAKPFLKAIAFVFAIMCPIQIGHTQSLLGQFGNGGEAHLNEAKFASGNGKNLIYFIHGVNCSDPSNYVSGHSYPHYFLMRLAQSGKWDVITADFRIGDCGGNQENISVRAGRFVARRMGELKSQGYQRIVLGGQSAGAWASLIAAQLPDLQADILMFLVPATWGKKVARNFELNKIEYFQLLPALKLPVVAVFFSNDEYDPGGRGEATEQLLTNASVPHLVIDRPEGFSGHGSAWLPVFDYKYGDCINRFLLNPQTTQCKPPPLSDRDFRSIASITQIKDVAEKRLTDEGFSALLGKKVVVYRGDGGEEEDTLISPTTVTIESANGVRTRAVSFSEGKFCFAPMSGDTVCRSIIKWSNHQLLSFDEKTGKTTGWWILKPRGHIFITDN